MIILKSGQGQLITPKFEKDLPCLSSVTVLQKKNKY